MVSEQTWIVITFLIFLTTIIPALLRTYFNWKTLKESRQYWNSWKKRQVDIARKVINGLGDDELIDLAKKVEEIRKHD